jgi:hypothetical protein
MTFDERNLGRRLPAGTTNGEVGQKFPHPAIPFQLSTFNVQLALPFRLDQLRRSD